MELMIVTGLSGAGKSQAVNALEDIGYYCVDNIPPRLMLELEQVFQTAGPGQPRRIAVVVDARSKELFSDLTQTLQTLKERQVGYQLLFLDASTPVLIQRYKESRRRHPMMGEGVSSLEEAIQLERELLAPLREMADYTIDTSLTIPAQLRERVTGLVQTHRAGQLMNITILSFGFRNGLPAEADLVFDMRCLPNPFYIPELRDHFGDEPAVRDYVMQFPETQELIRRIEELLDYSVPLYQKEGRSQFLIGVGCTGGKHRSVATAIRLGDFLRDRGYAVTVSHRDKTKHIFR